ncbi:MAG: hypothetical protein OXI54_07300 [Chloroflexota bacterium]|nr:hypothetical protein [Chloroflexota bacterium]MDE2683937.1 hypothetical protein [Chloroflexota bacterium]
MTTPRELYDLQVIDHRIDSIDTERKRVEQRLAAGVNRPDLTDEAERHSSQALTIADNVHSRREEVDRLQERLAGLESRLYSGNTSRRDLSAVQREVDSTRYQISQLDDTILEQEEAQRTHEEAAQSARTEMQDAEDRWQGAETQLNDRLSELAREREEAEDQRQSLAATLPGADLQRYERLRRNKAGTAIALVDNGRVCVSCRMTLTTNVMRQLRDRSRQVPCSACGRILYQP